MTDSGFVVLLLMVVVGLFLLFLPGIIARKRHHRNATAITVCQFLFWPVALIWAFTDNCEPVVEYSSSTEAWTGSLGLAAADTSLNCQTCGKPDCADISHIRAVR
jgi:hypothetical protein